MAINRHAVELGVLLGLGNTLIFMHNLPPVSDVRAAQPFNPQVESGERTALLETTALTLLVAGFARSIETFIVAGAVIIAVDFTYKHANAVNPSTNKMVPAGQAGLNQASSDNSSAYPLPNYGYGTSADVAG